MKTKVAAVSLGVGVLCVIVGSGWLDEARSMDTFDNRMAAYNDNGTRDFDRIVGGAAAIGGAVKVLGVILCVAGGLGLVVFGLQRVQTPRPSHPAGQQQYGYHGYPPNQLPPGGGYQPPAGHVQQFPPQQQAQSWQPPPVEATQQPVKNTSPVAANPTPAPSVQNPGSPEPDGEKV